MNCRDDGTCGWRDVRWVGERCKRPTDVRYVFILHGAKGDIEALLPFGVCSEHCEILPRMLDAESPELLEVPGIVHAVNAYVARFGVNPDSATILMMGIETPELQEYLRIAKASDSSGAGAPVVVEHARADDVKADMGEQAYDAAFGKPS